MSVYSSLRDEVSSKRKILGSPPLVERKWLPVENSGAKGKNLTLLQWNVLADGLSGRHPTKGDFIMSPTDSLDWKSRRWALLEEILYWDCDLLTMQEVDHHHDFFAPMLERAGYCGLFVKKPSAPGLDYGAGLEDGCSLFYKHEGLGGRGLHLLDVHSFTYAIVNPGQEINESTVSGGGGVDIPERVTQNQVATLALFRVKLGGAGGSGGDESSLLIVVTTHLKATKNTEGEIVRAQQIKQLLVEIERFRYGHATGRGASPETIPVVLAGDLNAPPVEVEGGSGSSKGYDPLCIQEVRAHSLGFHSAFDLDGMFTTWKIRPAVKGWTGPPSKQERTEIKSCMDYVWVTKGVEILRRSSLPTGDDLGVERIPSHKYPSDHFALAVELKLKLP
ncbi:unnamed protein product [Choristocarpus tenellus]